MPLSVLSTLHMHLWVAANLKSCRFLHLIWATGLKSVYIRQKLCKLLDLALPNTSSDPMGGFLAPDPLKGFTKVFHPFAFIGIPRTDGQRDQRPRFKIRHQNPRLNEPGVAPCRPLRPSNVGVGPVNIIPDQIHEMIRLGPTPLTSESSSLSNKIIKQRSNSQKRKSRNPVPSPPEADRLAGEKYTPTVEVHAKQLIVLSKDLVAPQSVELTSTHASTDNGQAAPEKDVPGSVSTQDHSALAGLRPRLPHQRLHFIRRIGHGGEGHCDLFRIHAAPQTLLAVKTLTRTPELVRHKNNKRKPLEAHILQDILSTPHPHICGLGDLQDVIEAYFSRNVTIPEGFIWHVYLGIAKALAYLHTGYIAPSSTNNRERRLETRPPPRHQTRKYLPPSLLFILITLPYPPPRRLRPRNKHPTEPIRMLRHHRLPRPRTPPPNPRFGPLVAGRGHPCACAWSSADDREG
ncbi:MAG: hypothetical protein Q9223_007955 [Gallowayella weberi]